MTKEKSSNVNHPSHYNSDPSGVECIDIVRHRNFNVGNAIKYLWRAGLKNDASMDIQSKTVEDLQKAVFYINDEIKRISKTEEVISPTGTEIPDVLSVIDENEIVKGDIANEVSAISISTKQFYNTDLINILYIFLERGRVVPENIIKQINKDCKLIYIEELGEGKFKKLYVDKKLVLTLLRDRYDKEWNQYLYKIEHVLF